MVEEKRAEVQNRAERTAEQARWEVDELEAEQVYARWLVFRRSADLESLAQWAHIVTLVPPYIEISVQHRAFLAKLRAVVRGAERFELDESRDSGVFEL